jgi:hypothetical protein
VDAKEVDDGKNQNIANSFFLAARIITANARAHATSRPVK